MRRETVGKMACGLWIILFLGASGCTTVQKGAGIGAASGGLIGGIIGNNGGEGTLEGALMGAAGGGLIGALIGDGMQDDNSAELENLRNQNDLLRSENEALRNRPVQPAPQAPPPPPVRELNGRG